MLSIYPGETFHVSIVSTTENGIIPAEVIGNVDRERQAFKFSIHSSNH